MTNSTEPQNLLPRFSNPKDIEEFVERLEAFERGDIDSEQFRAFRLLRGVYKQKQENLQMLRAKIPFGRVGRAQLEALADIADGYGAGLGHVTTRQNVQFHNMPMDYAEKAMHLLNGVGITTRDACGHSVRTMTACEKAETCPDAPVDVSLYTEALTRWFLGHPLASSLPRKFKVAFSGCAHDCAKAAIHDLGFVATSQNGVPGFRVLVGGGLSNSPEDALVIDPFVEANLIGRAAEAVVRLFHAQGNRENKKRARIKYLKRKLGEETFLKEYLRIRAEVDAEATAELTLPTPLNLKRPDPVIEADAKPLSSYLLWSGSSVERTKESAYVSVWVRLQLGDITSTQMRALGRIIDRFADGTARLTIDQNILIPWVHEKSLPAIHRALSDAGLARTEIKTAKDVTSCPGASTCALSVTASRTLATAIEERLGEKDAADLRAMKDTDIKISGCPNGCGQHHVADLGFHGGAKRVGTMAVPVYELHLGGGVDERGARFGKLVAKIVANRVPDAVVTLLRMYERDAAVGITPTTFFSSADPKKVLAELAPHMGEILPTDAFDIGETEGFVVNVPE